LRKPHSDDVLEEEKPPQEERDLTGEQERLEAPPLSTASAEAQDQPSVTSLRSQSEVNSEFPENWHRVLCCFSVAKFVSM